MEEDNENKDRVEGLSKTASYKKLQCECGSINYEWYFAFIQCIGCLARYKHNDTGDRVMFSTYSVKHDMHNEWRVL